MLNKMLNWRKKNNKGFSLIELIIVIAIMAILVGILAPQFIKYVDQSRQSTDVKNFQEVMSAISVYCADPANGTNLPATPATGTATLGDFTLNQNAKATVTADSVVSKALTAAGLNPDNIMGKSATYKEAKLSAAIDTNGNVVFTTTSDALSKAAGITKTS